MTERIVQKIREWFREKKHTVWYLLPAALGLLLLIYPAGSGGKAKTETVSALPQTDGTDAEAAARALEERLESLLSRMRGVGRVMVLLTVENSGCRTLAQDAESRETHETADGADRSTSETQYRHVLTSDGGGGEEPVVLSSSSPVYRGAVVLCQGGDSAQIRYQVTEAVAAVTGLRTDVIAVQTMR